MKALSSAVVALALILVATAAAPGLRAETPDEQAKACGGIPLTTGLLDKMDAFLKGMSSDAAAKAELTEINKDPAAGTTPEGWVAAINSKCPKTAANLKAAGLSADDFAKGEFALMGCSMSEDLVKSADATVKANAEFVKANNDRATQTFKNFIELTNPFEEKK